MPRYEEASGTPLVILIVTIFRQDRQERVSKQTVVAVKRGRLEPKAEQVRP